MLRRTVLIIAFCALFSIRDAEAQFYYFGHNKVQYTNFDWQILRTEHFEVYYYPEMKELAQQGAYVAEQSFKILEARFNHTVLQRIPLIFYSSHLHFQQTNTTGGFIPEGVGGFFEFLKGRVVIPADGSIARFRHVIRHELVHVFMHSKISRVMVDHRLPQDRTPPLWFTEGLAEAWSADWDDQAEMLMRDAVLNNYVVPVAGMDQIAGTFLMYKEGQHLLSFIEKEYGDEKVLMLMENFWRSSSFNDVMKATIGKTYAELDAEWLYALKKKYYPVLSYSDYTERAARVIVKNGFNTKPVFYNNAGSREVYFIGNYTGYTSIYKITLSEKEKEREPQVVLVGEKSDEFEAFHLFQSKMDVSKDGRLVFVTKSGESDVIHVYDLAANELLRTLQFPGLVVLASPCWSPEGKKIVFSSVDKSGMMDLYVYDFSDERLQRLTNDPYDDRDPVWAPDGRAVVFSSDRGAFGLFQVYNLYRYDIASEEIIGLTSGKYNFYSPSFSPDGRYITCTSTIDGTQNIWALPYSDRSAKPQTYALRKATNFSNAVFDPRWTDDDKLLFAGFENYNFKLYVLDSALERLDTASQKQQYTSAPARIEWLPSTLAGDTTVHFSRYEGNYSLDIAQSVVSNDPVFGTTGGAALAVSDVLGNDQYYFLLYNNAQASDEFLESFNLAVSKISLGQRTNYAAGIFHFSGRRYDLTDPDEYFYERAFGGYITFSYPLSKFRRIEASSSLSNSDKEVFTGMRPRKALILSNALSFVHDNSLWGPTGPLDGSRFIATVAYTSDIQYSNVYYYTLIADYRYYMRLDQRTAMASRFQVMMNEGMEARRFFMGGSWDLRGFPRWSLRGKKLWLMSHEIRFPFIDQLAIRFPFGNFNFGLFRGALFFDAGNAWDNVYQKTLGSIGTGIRWNIGGILVLRYDMGKQILDDFNSLQNGFFYQFFFGWDF